MLLRAPERVIETESAPMESPISAAINQPPNALETGRSVQDRPPIIGCLGRGGGGKSLLASYLIGEHLARHPDFTILHNGPLLTPPFPSSRVIAMGLQDMLAALNSERFFNVIAFIDEVHEWIDPYRATNTAALLLSHIFTQTRKSQIWFVWTTQKPADVHPRLAAQTDFTYEVDTSKRLWIPRGKGLDPEYTENARYARRCPSTRVGHPHCSKFEKSHTLNLKLVAQENSTLQTGTTFYGKLHCAQRFYALYDTSKRIYDMDALTMTTDDMRERERFKLQNMVGAVVNELVENGVEDISSAEFAGEMNKRRGVEISDVAVGKFLSRWGIEQERTSKRRYWVLEELNIVEADESA